MSSLAITCTVLAATFALPPLVSQELRLPPKLTRSTYYAYFAASKHSSRSANPSGTNRYHFASQPTELSPATVTSTESVAATRAAETLHGQAALPQQNLTVEFLEPRGLKLTAPGPYPPSLAYVLHLHVNLNHDFKGLKRGDWNKDGTFPRGALWTYTFPDIKVNYGDTVYYWLEVKGQDGEMRWFREYKGFRRNLEAPQESTLEGVFPVDLPHPRPTDRDNSVPESPVQTTPEREGPVAQEQSIAVASALPENAQRERCQLSKTTYNNGKTPCAGQDLVTRSMFDSVEQISGYEPEERFTVFSHNNIVKNVTNYNTDVYTITPILLEERYGPDFVDKSLKLPDCTTKDPDLCSARAVGYFILPPIISGRATSEKTLFFRYGVLEVTAKLPTGDWVVPELWLMPKNRMYGDRSGKIVLAMSRGNRQLNDGSQDYSSSVLEAGIVTSSGSKMFRKEQARPWADDYHKFKLVWTPDILQFFVDNSEIGRIQPVDERIDPAVQGTKMAPFDQEFYLVFGIHVGGEKDFPDSLMNKPWINHDPKNKMKFWRDRNKWKPTWSDDTALHVAAITLKALNA